MGNPRHPFYRNELFQPLYYPLGRVQFAGTRKRVIPMNRRTFLANLFPTMAAVAATPLVISTPVRASAPASASAPPSPTNPKGIAFHEVCGNCKSWYKREDQTNVSDHSNLGDAYPLSIGACGCDMAKAIIYQESKNRSGGKKAIASFDTWSDSDACTQYRNAEREEFRVGRMRS